MLDAKSDSEDLDEIEDNDIDEYVRGAFALDSDVPEEDAGFDVGSNNDMHQISGSDDDRDHGPGSSCNCYLESWGTGTR